MNAAHFEARGATASQDVAEDRRVREQRAADLQRLADRTDASWQAERAARAIRECAALDDRDLIVLLEALAAKVSCDNLHLEDRRELVDELHGMVECRQEAIEAEAAWHGVAA